MSKVSKLNIELKELFPLKVLRKFLDDKTKHVTVVPRVRTIVLPPFCLGDKKSGINHVLNSMLKTYDRGLDGIVIGFRKVKEIKTEETGAIRDSSGGPDLIISAEYFIFRPKRGSTFHGIVKKKTKSRVCCIVQRYFKVTILKPNDLPFDTWICRDLKVRDKVIVQVTELDFTVPIPILEGILVGIPLAKNPSSKSDGNNEKDESKESDGDSEDVVEENEDEVSFAKQLEMDVDAGAIDSDEELPEEDWADLMNVDGICSDGESPDRRDLSELPYEAVYPPAANEGDTSSTEDESSEALKQKKLARVEVMRYKYLVHNYIYRNEPSMEVKVYSSSEEWEEESQDRAVRKAMGKEVTLRGGRSSGKIEPPDTSGDEKEEADKKQTSAGKGTNPKQVGKTNDK